MRPSKNRFFCPHCKNFKLGFETEKEAYRFIAFQSESILEENGYCPIRAYKCPVCRCWHLTSESLGDEDFSEFIIDKEVMDTSQKLLGLVNRNTRTIALNLAHKVNGLSQILRSKVVDWDIATSLIEEVRTILDKVQNTPYRYVYHVREQSKIFFQLCRLYEWRRNLIVA